VCVHTGAESMKIAERIDVEELKRRISIVDLVGHSLQVVGTGHTRTTKEHDSLKLFTHNNSWYWYSKAKGGDVIDWYRMVNGCDFKTAIEELGGSYIRTSSPSPVTSHQPPTTKPQDDNWRKRAGQRVQTAQKHLQSNHPAGVEYLTNKRGLDVEVCKAWGLGFDPMVHYSKDDNGNWQHAPAIMFPYIDLDGQIIGVRYRWLDVVNGDKSFALGGSQFGSAEFGLYRLYNQKRGSNALWVCEGEINALSVLQFGYDAVSVGSESAKLTNGLIELSKDYHQVICWMDKSKNAAVNAKRLGAKAIKSPKGLDANDLLQKGLLADFIEKIL